MINHVRTDIKRSSGVSVTGHGDSIHFHAVSKMEVGPPEPPCRWRFQTTVSCCPLRGMVVSVTGKGSTRWSQVSAMETNESEPLTNCRKRRNVIKTVVSSLSRDESGRSRFGVECIKNPDTGHSCRKAYLLSVQTVTGMKVASTRHRLRYGTWEPAFRCKGRNPSGRTARIRIPIRNAGTEQSVVVMNPRNGGGAKGLCYPVLFRGQPKGRSS